jgi:putative restriction endonuclease
VAEYHFGEVGGQPVGTTYESRLAVKDARVHQVTQQGIAGNRHVGCVSIVLSGGYETDVDHGHEIFYTGAGGQDPKDRRVQVAHQDLSKSDNAALVRSQETGNPIRIIRGSGHQSEYAPPNGYRYDGLYRVLARYEMYPPDGFRRWMFHLVQLSFEQAQHFTPRENLLSNMETFLMRGLGSGFDGGTSDGLAGAAGATPDLIFDDVLPASTLSSGTEHPATRETFSRRVIRDTKVAANVKALYVNSCQICGTQVVTRTGLYSEGAHIRPLGRPHHGPDIIANVLCLCPNHHASLDAGGLYVQDDRQVVTSSGQRLGTLRLHPDHKVDFNHVRYHRNQHGYLVDEVR